MNYKENKKDPEQIKEPDLGGVYTYKDYMTWEMDYMVELIRGKVFKMTPAPTSRHQRISINLTGKLWTFFKEQSCEVFCAPFDVILPVKNTRGETDTVVQPDLCVVCNPSKIKERGCFGPPDLIIEILSKTTSNKDRKIKHKLYEETGVKEYWIVNPKDQVLEVFVLKEWKYEKSGHYSSEETVHPVHFPNCAIDLKEVFD